MNPDHVIKLAQLNPGFGFTRFVKRVSNTKNKQRIFDILEVHKHETGEDLYAILQDNSYSRNVSIPEYMRITGNKYPPAGYGRGSGGRTSRATMKGEAMRNIMVPLPPQEFKELDQLENVVEQGFSVPKSFRTLFDFLTAIEHYNDGDDPETISNYVEASPGMIKRFIEQYEEVNDLERNWVPVLQKLWEIECERGSTPKHDDLVRELRTTFHQFTINPTDSEEATPDDVQWCYEKLLEEEDGNLAKTSPEQIAGDNFLLSDNATNWIEYFESVKFEERIEETWRGNSLGSFVSWLEEFLSRGWKVNGIQSFDDSSDLHVKFMKM